MLLARQGARVLLVDRATFPSDSMRAHFVRGAGVAALARWGLLDRVVATGVPAIGQFVTDLGDGPLPAPVSMFDGVASLFAPRRIVLDAILVDEAAAAGADVRQAFTVEELVWEDGAVTGIRGRSRGGSTVTERARLVVGADGMRSLVAREVNAPVYDHHPASTCGYYNYFDGPPVDVAAVAQHSSQFAVAVPTNDNLTFAFVAAPIAALPEFRADAETAFFRTLDRVPWLAELIRGRCPVERWRGTGDLPSFFRRPYGPGWALVGDAGYHQDPITARGISNAFRDAELLAEAITASLSGHRSMTEALAGYERQRNAVARPIFEEAVAWAEFRPFPPQLYEQRAALRTAAA
jgi:2-polyprenyl-6-methoxyphenol hydroxylase-like FAD-dependent oxidoreductase